MKKYLFFFLFLGVSLFANDCAFNPVPVPEPTPEAISYYESGNVLWAIQFVWSLFVPALLLYTGFSIKLRNFFNLIASKWLWQDEQFPVTFGPRVIVISILPFSSIESRALMHRLTINW